MIMSVLLLRVRYCVTWRQHCWHPPFIKYKWSVIKNFGLVGYIDNSLLSSSFTEQCCHINKKNFIIDASNRHKFLATFIYELSKEFFIIIVKNSWYELLSVCNNIRCPLLLLHRRLLPLQLCFPKRDNYAVCQYHCYVIYCKLKSVLHVLLSAELPRRGHAGGSDTIIKGVCSCIALYVILPLAEGEESVECGLWV